MYCTGTPELIDEIVDNRAAASHVTSSDVANPPSRAVVRDDTELPAYTHTQDPARHQPNPTPKYPWHAPQGHTNNPPSHHSDTTPHRPCRHQSWSHQTHRHCVQPRGVVKVTFASPTQTRSSGSVLIRTTEGQYLFGYLIRDSVRSNGCANALDPVCEEVSARVRVVRAPGDQADVFSSCDASPDSDA